MLLLTLPGTCAQARRKSAAWARSQFAAADRLRDALNQRPSPQRTRHDYERVISAYREVYLGAPTAGAASAGVANAAEVMAEMGRRFEDRKALQSAIRQYEFLRDEYPSSPYRFQALFAIAEIYKDDLNEPKRAEQGFNEFLRRYPHHSLADDARQALAEIAGGKQDEEAKADPPVHDSGAASGVKSATPEDDSPADASEHSSSGKDASAVRVAGIRYWTMPDCTRISIDLDHDVKYEAQRIGNPDRVYFDLANTRLTSELSGKSFDVEDGFLKQIRVAQYQPDQARIVLDVDSLSDYTSYLLENPPRLVIDVREPQSAKSGTESDGGRDAPSTAAADEPSQATAPVRVADASPRKIIVEADDEDDSAPAKPELSASKRTSAKHSQDADSPTGRHKTRGSVPAGELSAREAKPTAEGDRSLIRALGLKIGRIVIDPGHGGHDTGTIGPNGLEEKDLVLDVSKRLGKLLESRLGADVTFTRNDDTFIPLETRTSIANQAQADLFVSIHANSSRDPSARGVETYYLNFTSSADALEVAARENAVSNKSIHELQDLVKTIALKEKIEESREFAADVQRSLHSGLSAKNAGLRDRGVKKAPFIVLIGANMPSILAEISFVSNPSDERRLKTPEYRQRIAESLYRGIAKYVSGLSGVKVASKVDRDVSQ